MSETVIPDLPKELAHDWYGLGTWAIIGLVGIFALLVWYDRKGFRARLTALEDDVAELKSALQRERDGHGQTQRILAAALRHLRELWAWIYSGHSTTPPDIPHELRDEI